MSRPQTIKIVIEQAAPSAAGLVPDHPQVEKPNRKARF